MPRWCRRSTRYRRSSGEPNRAAGAYYAVLCYLLGDFRPYLWKPDDYGAHWALLTSGTSGIRADEPTRVGREESASMVRQNEADLARWLTKEQCQQAPGCATGPSVETIFKQYAARARVPRTERL